MRQQGTGGENHSRFQRLQGEGPGGWRGSFPMTHTRPRPWCTLEGEDSTLRGAVGLFQLYREKGFESDLERQESMSPRRERVPGPNSKVSLLRV